MTTRNVVWMVARRELRTRMLTKANLISTGVMLALILVGTVVGHILLNKDTAVHVDRVAVSPSAEGLRDALQAAATEQDLRLSVETMTAAQARAALTDGAGDLTAFLDGAPAAPSMLVAADPDADVLGVVSAAVRSYVVREQIEALHGDAGAFERALAGAAPRVERLTPAEPDRVNKPVYGISMVMISLLLFTLMGSGSMIAMGVVEEKTSRVVEILLATIRPRQLLAGKIIGIGIFGLTQVLVLGGAMAGAMTVLGLGTSLDVDLLGALAGLVLWFLLGYALFALLFGGFAALVSRQEDIGSVTTPLIFLLLTPFYVTLFLVPNDPDGTATRVLSFVPFFAPFMMPVRSAFGGMQAWELPLAVLLCAVTIPVLVVVAARVYQRGVLHTGGRMKLAQALRG